MTRRGSISRSRRALRWGAALGAAVLLLGACGSTKKSDEGSDTTGGASAAENGPGVTDDEVKVGFVNLVTSGVAQQQQFLIADQGDARAQIQALVDYVNDNGGLGGRTMVPVIRDFDGSADSPQTEEQLCNAFTQDDKVFAVVIQGQFQQNARPCYAKQQTLVLDVDLVGQDAQAYEDLAPYLWTPLTPTYEETLAALVTTLEDHDFLGSDAKVGIMAADTEVNKRLAEGVQADLEAAGATVVATEYVDTTNAGTIFGSLPAVIQKFKSTGANRVVVIGGARMMAFFTTLATGEGFTPRLAVTTYDNPTYFGLNAENGVPTDMLKDAVGVAVQVNRDVTDEILEFPSENEEQCAEIFDKAGVTFDAKLDPAKARDGIETQRIAARTAMQFCDAVLLLQAGAKGTEKGLNAEVWAENAQQLGDSLQLASAYRTEFREGRYAGGAAYRVIVWDPEAKKFVFEGEDVPIDEG